MELRELLHTDRAVCVDAADCLWEASKYMTATRSGCVFVLEGEERLIGILTDGDLRRCLDVHGSTERRKVVEVMTPHPVCLLGGSSLVEAYQVFQQHGINTLPVLGSDGKYLGYVEFHEVVAALSPERIYPQVRDEDENVQRHRARYEFAAQFVPRGGTVLDCACGSGYGSEILAEKADRVIGVDKAQEAIDYAELHHHSPKVLYHCAWLEDVVYKGWFRQDVGPAGLDAVVVLETLEHVTGIVCRTFLCDIRVCINPGGVLVASSPMLRYRDGKPYVTSPYHVNEVPKLELLRMFEATLPGWLIHYYHQKQDTFLPLMGEDDGFLVVVARRPSIGFVVPHTGRVD